MGSFQVWFLVEPEGEESHTFSSTVEAADNDAAMQQAKAVLLRSVVQVWNEHGVKPSWCSWSIEGGEKQQTLMTGVQPIPPRHRFLRTENPAYLVTIPRLERDEPYTTDNDAGCSLLEEMADDDLDYVITLALDDIGQGDPGDNYPDDLDCRRSSVTCRKLTNEEADKDRPDRYIG
jgi:hypothetical protein